MGRPEEISRLAVLIDAENAPASAAKEILEEIAKHGTATVRRAYGDWTSQNLKGWKEHLHRHAIQPIQQFSYTTGKNSSDSSLIIDAMDILHSGNVEGFCLISSDSDFTRLATRFRESGMKVFGFGEKKTPEAFVAACNKFTFSEILRPNPEGDSTPGPVDSTLLDSILRPAVEAVARENGWSALSTVGSHISKNHPSFDSRSFGFPRLSELVKSRTYLEHRDVSDAGLKSHLQVRIIRTS